MKKLKYHRVYPWWEFWHRYKYELDETITYPTGVTPIEPLFSRYLTLSITGVITIGKGYRWDGPSGPSIDTETFMHSSLLHDAFHQLIRMGHVAIKDRWIGDEILFYVSLLDGMAWFRALYSWVGVRLFGWIGL
jgi:hypothetical protein